MISDTIFKHEPRQIYIIHNPSLNSAYLGTCLDSIINQDFPHKEIILINDGSSDNSPYICAKYASKYDFVHVINQKNMGTSSARNRGMETAKCDYIWFVDSDDMIADEIASALRPHMIDDSGVKGFILLSINLVKHY